MEPLKAYRLEVSDTAAEQLEQIYDYISQVFHAPDTAYEQISRIKEKINTLQLFPMRHRVFAGRCRRLNVDSYAIIYHVTEECVYIDAVLSGRMDIAARFENPEKST